MKANCFAFSLILLTSGCHTTSHERLMADIGASIKPGMTIAEASNHLVQEGFHCDSRVMAPSITCTRIQQSLLPSTCIARVNLQPSDNGETVETVELAKLACAGL
jgi:hypothetical protein